MTGDASPLANRHAPRVQAVLALFGGASMPEVSWQYGIGRSALYGFRKRALTAIHGALADRRRGPRRCCNRIPADKEAQVVALCQHHSTLSSYAVRRRCDETAPSPRTIQRIRARHGLTRFSKRAPPLTPRHRLTSEAVERVNAILTEKPFLGPDRTVWDLQNHDQITISPSTIKRMKRKRREALLAPRPPRPDWCFYERHHPHSLWHGDFMEKVTLTDIDKTAFQLTLQDDYSRGYVFCDLFQAPDVRTTIRALIAGMRTWRVIPKAVVFDNGAPFKGRLLSAFCEQLDIRLIHASVNHPQTNGKLERAFRDDMRDFYEQYDPWLLDELRRDLPAYVHYRNYVRGHRALGGKPAITRLNEYTHMALPAVLERLETYACYAIGPKIIPATSKLRLFGRDAHLDRNLANVEVTLFESLAGLEARLGDQCVAILKDYRSFKQMTTHFRGELPRALYFEPYEPVICPRIAGAP